MPSKQTQVTCLERLYIYFHKSIITKICVAFFCAKYWIILKLPNKQTFSVNLVFSIFARGSILIITILSLPLFRTWPRNYMCIVVVYCVGKTITLYTGWVSTIFSGNTKNWEQSFWTLKSVFSFYDIKCTLFFYRCSSFF